MERSITIVITHTFNHDDLVRALILSILRRVCNAVRIKLSALRLRQPNGITIRSTAPAPGAVECHEVVAISVAPTQSHSNHNLYVSSVCSHACRNRSKRPRLLHLLSDFTSSFCTSSTGCRSLACTLPSCAAFVQRDGWSIPVASSSKNG